MDFTFITGRLATGGAIASAADVQALVNVGVTHVIDCRDDFDDGKLLAAHPSVTYLWNPTADDGQPKPASWFQRSLEFALPALAKPHVKVYAHCQAGINRGPSTAYAILLAQGWTAFEARAKIIVKRPIALVRYAKDAEAAVIQLGYV